MCILKTHKEHSIHSKLITKDFEGNLTFNPAMWEDQTSTLFMLIMEALGSHADKLSIDMKCADGIKLWHQLNRINLDINTDVTNQETLSHQFEILSWGKKAQATDENTTTSIQEQVQVPLQDTLGTQGMQLLSELESMNSTIVTKESKRIAIVIKMKIKLTLILLLTHIQVDLHHH